MIDFIKANISSSNEGVRACSHEFTYETRNIATKQSENWLKAKIYNMVILIKGKYIELKGSLHKLKNYGEHNFDDFTYEELVDILISLCDTLDINAKTSIIENMEFGVNIKVPFNPKEFLEKQVISYKGKEKTINKPIAGKGWVVEFENTKYIVKFYDKSGQYGLGSNILRFEVKSKKSEFFKSTFIKTLEDLKNLEKLHLLKPILFRVFNDLLIVDPIKEINFEIDDEQKIQLFLNPVYLQSIKPKSKDFLNGNQDTGYRKKRMTYYNEMNKFKKLLNKYNLLSTKKMLLGLIITKCDELVHY